MILLRTMTPADFPLLLRLRTQAGWNQTEQDLHRYFELQGEGGFVAEWKGQPVGTAITFVFGPVAWIAMVLVDASLRGQGIGTALMRQALAYLDNREVKTVRLDATPLGRPVYEKLGFTSQYTVCRHEGTPGRLHSPIIQPLAVDDLPEVLRLDRQVTGADREALIRRLYQEHSDAWYGSSAGVVAWRPGCNATMIGPCLATQPDLGESLLRHALGSLSGQRVFIDIPEGNTPAIACVRALGLTVQRPLLRMVRGIAVNDEIDRLWASSGPEKG